MLGGASAHWTKDGAVTINLPSILGEADPAAARHTTEEVSNIVNNTDMLALESNLRYSSITAAQNKAKLIISGNTAQRGGGIGSNGTVMTGEEGTQDVTVKKVWDTSANPDAVIPETLTVYLKADGYVVDSVELSAANNWEHTFHGLPDNVTLSFTEGTVVGWTAQTPEVNGNVTTLTNKADAPVTRDVPVTKVWNGTKKDSVTVHLLADGVDTGQTLVLSEANNWTGSFAGVNLYAADGHAIAYTVSEDAIEGYVVASVAGVDAPVPARMLARRQDIEYFNHRDPERLLKLREKILHAQVEDIKALGSTMPQSYDDLSIVVFGAKDAIEASKLDLKVVDLFGGQEN